MIINLQTGKSSPKARVNYLLHGTKGNRDPSTVDILQGNADLFTQIAEQNPYKVKTYNILISFAESKEELERKLALHGKTIQDLYEEVFFYLFPPDLYPPEALNVLTIGHSDTDNYHIHLTVENMDHERGRSLYIPKNRQELKFYRALEEFISAKYGLEYSVSPQNKGKAGIEKIKQILEERGTYRSKTRDEVKEEITVFLLTLIASGEINSREELVAYLKSIDGVEITRAGKSYITLKYGNERIRLKGGIYDEERFREVKREIEGRGKPLEELEGVFERVRHRRNESIKKRRKPKQPEKGILPANEGSHDREFREPEIVHIRTERRAKETWLDSSFSLDWTTAVNSLLSPQIWKNCSPFQADNGDKRETLLSHQGRSGGIRSTAERNLAAAGSNSSMHTSRSIAEQQLRELEKMREELMEIRRLEIELLKELDPEKVLSALGIDYKEMNGYLLMHSPIRDGDKHPSFTVFYGTNVGYWICKDHAMGWKGSSIDLWQAVRNVDYITAVQEMRETFDLNLLERSHLTQSLKRAIGERIKGQRAEQREKRQKLNSDREFTEKLAHRILEVSDKITRPELLKYLKKRGIERIPAWLKQIRYFHIPTQKEYYGLAVQNYSGAWNVRNNVRSTKGKYVILEEPSQKQTFSWIKRDENNTKVAIVEGLFDALSLEQLATKRDYDIVILNGVSNANSLLNSGILDQYETVVLLLDNDRDGIRTAEFLKERLEYEAKEVKEVIYKGKDLNEYLTKHLTDRITVRTVFKPYFAGVKNNRLIVADSRKVFEKLGVEVIRPVSNSEDILRLWEIWDYERIKLYLESGNEIPSWLQGQGFKIEMEKYWNVDGEPLFESEIYQNPSLYRKCDIEEIRRLAEEILKRRGKEKKRTKHMNLPRDTGRSCDPGL